MIRAAVDWPSLQFSVIHVMLFACRLVGSVMFLARRRKPPDLLMFKTRMVSQHGMRSGTGAPQPSPWLSKRGTRAGWRAAFKRSLPTKTSIPALL